MIKLRFWLPSLLLWGCLIGSAWAQGSALVRDSILLPGTDTLRLSQTWMVPGSGYLVGPLGDRIANDQYQLDELRGVLVLKGDWPEGLYLFYYRHFLQGPARRISLRPLPADTFRYPADRIFYQEEAPLSSGVFWETDQIRKSGSISRGITVGNNRSLSLNSGLRLQLEGDLGDGLKIVGAISDDNVPIQPDGTTQQLSDFDRIFLRLSKNQLSASIGDFEVEQKGSRFADLYRNVQGLQLGWKDEKTQVTVSGAVAKGKFHSNSIQGIDGVSGPYRLTGRNGERFFIVLAGSERVFINGQLLQRGENLDYVINYNTAEVIFTARHVITNITRIVVDFEYNDQFYNRSLMVATLDQQLLKDRVRVRFSYARDADNQNAPFNNDQAYALARDTLSKISDPVGPVTTPGVFEVGWSAEGLRYEAVDTTLNGIPYRYFRYSRDSSRAVFSLFFSFVGQGNGDYEPDRSGINANIFEWVAPDLEGNSQGSYAPIRSWVLPKLLQVSDTRIDVRLAKRLSLSSETAVSLEDLNRLSLSEESKRQGLAQRSSLTWDELRIGDTLRLSMQVSQQYVGLRYENLDRVYQAEYDRIWDLDPGEIRRDEHIVEAKSRLEYPGRAAIAFEGGLRSVGPGRMADRQVLTIESQLPKFIQGSYLLTRIARRDSATRQSEWWRHEGDLSVPFGTWRTGVTLWVEDRQIMRLDSADGSFSFYDLKPYLRKQGKKLELEASFNVRRDRAFLQDSLREKSIASTTFLRIQYQPTPVLSLRQVTAYRSLEVLDSLFRRQGTQDSRTLNTNWQVGFNPKKKWLVANMVYEVTAEQLAKQEIRYLQVNPGQGQYVWLDSLFNNDGIQDIGEFQLATNPLVADFVRVIVPSRELSPTTRLSLSGGLRWDFREVIAPSSIWWKQTIRQIRINTTLRVTQNKDQDGEGRADFSAYFVQFGNWQEDSSLLNATYSLRQDLVFFQNSPKGDIRFAWLDNQSLLFLTTGQEQRQNRYLGFAQRYNFSESRSVDNELRIGRRLLTAENFSERNYFIPYLECSPKLNVQWNRKIRVSGGYTFKNSENLEEGKEANARVNQHRVIMDGRINISQRNNIFVKGELVRLNQTGDIPVAAAFEMKEGLEPGWNGLWQAFFTWYVLQNVEFSLTYDGRAAAGQPVIHTGRVQVRAFF